MNPKNVHIKIELMSKLRDMKKRFLPLSMLLITIVLAQASFVANATGVGGKYTPRTASKATFSSFMKSIRANQETGLIDPADMIAAQKAAQTGMTRGEMEWTYAGPDNYGGLTRAIVYKADGTVIIGTMFGDIYQTTNGGITFRKISNVNLPISCMVSDANGNIYIGTGDGRDAQDFNGLSVLGYETSFIGKGVYKMAAGSTTPELLTSTDPTADEGWGYVNELAYTNGKIYAATAAGIMMSENNGDSWTNLMQGVFRSVKANNNGDVLAADGEDVYLANAGGEFHKITDSNDLPAVATPKIIAMSTTDKNFMYIAYLASTNSGYQTGNIYITTNGGDSWSIALAGTSMYPIFGTDANYDGFMIVYPNNPRKLLIGSDNLWVFEDEAGEGVFRPLQISEYNTAEFSAIAWNRYYYLHQGIQTIAFDPSNPNTFFIGTTGGVYKGEYYENLYSYKSSNRYFLTEDQHTSVARMMNVGVGGINGFVIGGSLDHGTLEIAGSENLNNETTGTLVFPHQTNNLYVSAYFSKEYAGGPCAISTIAPNIYFLTTTGSLSTPIYRTQTAGVDFDQNFEGGGDSPVITNANAFRTPFSFFETYNDTHTATSVDEILETYNLPIDTLPVVDTLFINDTVFVTEGTICAIETDTLGNPTLHFYNEYPIYDPAISEDTVLYEAGGESLFIFHIMHDYLYTDNINLDTLFLSIRRDAKAGDVVNYYSIQGDYPISYTLPEPPHDNQHVDTVAGGYKWIPGDTIRGLHDPLRTILVCAVEDKVYMTKDALIFDKPTDWFQISAIDGIPTAVAMTSDGETAYVGTAEGNFYSFSHLTDVFAAEQADVTNTLNPCVTMTTDETTFAGRAITSISVNPSNKNQVLVTLGNYGNTDYVYVSENGGTQFTALSGLPAVPVYSGVIEKSSGLYIVGTECGIYTSGNGSTWEKSGDFSCPIMDIKQAWMENHDPVIDQLYDDAGNVTLVIYPGIDNEGMLYAATYGSGILACGAFKEGGDLSVDEDEVTEEENVQLNIYPNPIRNNGNIDITLTESANVSYQIYDLSGRMVANSDLGTYGQGSHTLTFNTGDLSSGSYIIRLQAGNKSETAKILVY